MKSQICKILDIEFPLIAFSHCRDVVAAVSLSLIHISEPTRPY